MQALQGLRVEKLWGFVSFLSMEIEFVPTMVKEGKLTGSVKLRIPTIEERLDYMEVVGFGSKSVDGEISQETQGLSATKRLLKPLQEKHLIEVSLMNGDEKFSSYDDLQYSEAGMAVIIECCAQLLTGFKPSKN